MVVFNTTFVAEQDVISNFLLFLKNDYIPLSLSENIILSYRLCKISSSLEDNSVSFALEFHFKDINDLNIWKKKIFEKLRTLIYKTYLNRVLYFFTIMDTIEL